FGRGGADREKADRSRFGRDGGRKNRTDGKSSERDRMDKGRGSRGYDRSSADRNSRYATLRIKTKKQKG
ncbi:MAG: hypothetical protein K2N98_04170, partial [Lachnospiraceae bacterium]|nr:hypothetical protein [Lachnospiraceae bacterium]